MPSVWRVHPTDPHRATAIARALDIHRLTAQLLLNRGVTDHHQARRFLRPGLHALDDPARLSDMARAVARLQRAIAVRETLAIFGDSDVDGIAASVILYEVLRHCGAVVHARVSNRITEGYGLPDAFVRSLCRSSVTLLVLVDCGTNQPDAVARLRAHGIETIIVDHHVPLEDRAQPYALINPHCHQDDGQALCSAGLALKLAQVLLGAGEEAIAQLADWLDLAALGTLADCAPLVGENRTIVSEGLPRIVRSERPGLRRLCEATGTRTPAPEPILRRLIPRLNASGRLGDARAVWKLLLRAEDDRLEEWVSATEAAHAATKQLHRRMAAEAHEQIDRMHFKDQFVLLVSGRGWHQGMMGPLASQLAQRYGRPAIALAMGERRGIGSGRSIPFFDLLGALKTCQEFLVQFGGHAQACGLTIDRRHVEPFLALLNQHVRHVLGRQGLLPTRMIDLELPLSGLEAGWLQEVERFAPFGHGNPQPTVMIRRVSVEVRSPRVAAVSDGVRQVVARGRWYQERGQMPAGPRTYYDVIATPAFVGGEPILTVSDVRGATAPSAPAQPSSRPCTPAAA